MNADCQACDGRGGWLETVRVGGEAFDADQREVDCDACDGTGLAEPDDDDALVFIERIAPTRIAL